MGGLWQRTGPLRRKRGARFSSTPVGEESYPEGWVVGDGKEGGALQAEGKGWAKGQRQELQRPSKEPGVDYGVGREAFSKRP